ncbi:MAG: O-antigen ligase family protein [Paludibacteraceae bacterium]|nr:O-antigen ligase family protein [Paludibacteraceae bacterium]
MDKYLHWIKQANYFMFLVLVASFPLPRNIMQWCWIIWAVTWLLEMRFLQPTNMQWGKRMIPSLFLLGWLLWECLSLIWGRNIGEGGRFPDYHASLFFFPLIALYGVNELYDWRKIAKVFIVSCVCSFFVYCWLLYWVANYDYVIIRNGDGPHLHFQLSYFDSVLSPIKHRMLYCSALGVAVILLFVLRKHFIEQWGKWKAYLFFFGSLGVLMTAILATGSRANLLTLVALGALAWMLQIKRHRVLIISLIVIGGIGCCLAIWKLHPRMKYLTIDQLTHVEEHYYDPAMQPRVVIWHLALQDYQDYIAKGLGIGNAKGYMGEKYEAVNLTHYKDQRYGAHNQYLYVCMELGLAAMILFIVFWYGMPLCFPKNSQARMFMLYFVLLFGINMLTDDNLSRIEGVIYTCTFLLLADVMAKSETNKALSDC